MPNRFKTFCLRGGLLIFGLLLPAPRASATVYMTMRAVPEKTRAARGEMFFVALDVQLAKDWAYYGPVPGLAAEAVGVAPARLDVQAGAFRVGEIRWPADHLKPAAYDFPAVWAYTDRAIIYVPLTVPKDAPLGPETITLRPRGQICGPGGCVDLRGFSSQEDFVSTATVTVADSSQPDPAWRGDLAEGLAQARTVEQLRVDHTQASAGFIEPDAGAGGELSFWGAIGVALLAGLVLNIMPCVLPVIPIRILSIVEMAGASRRRFVTMGLCFALGMMLFFAAIAGINVVLKLAVGSSFDLNQAFQSPAVIVALAMIVLALAANLLGAFNVVVPRKVVGLESAVQARAAGHAKSLGMGVMMAVLATPCSFAFLAAALTYAQTAPLAAGTAVILAVGLGMSAPHVLLAAWPQLVDRLPKPGRWMELFKQTTGFVLLLVVVWLVGTLRGEGSSYPFWVTAWGVILVLCLWMWGGWVRYDASWRRKWLIRSLAVVLAAGSGVWMLRPPAPPLLEAVPFNEAGIEEARRDGRVLLVRFSAAWCVKCVQQDYQVFDTPVVAKAVRDLDAVYMKGDVTRGDSPAAKWMRRSGYGAQVPMTIIVPPRGQPFPPIREELTAELLIEKLQAAKKR